MLTSPYFRAKLRFIGLQRHHAGRVSRQSSKLRVGRRLGSRISARASRPAVQLMVRRDPSEPRLAGEPLPQDAPQAKQRNTLPLDRVTTVLAGNVSDSSSPDFAAHLPLQQIAEQACLATRATAAAIALRQGDEIVCRATVGPNAPDLGMSLNISSGLSGACVRTRQVQYCDDTETDARVDAAACRSLQVRSVLVVPLVHGDELLGVFEIFSPQPHAFAHQDLQTLHGLAHWIEENIGSVTEGSAPAAPAPDSAVTVASSPEPPRQPEPPTQEEVQPSPWSVLDPSYQPEPPPPPRRATTASSLVKALERTQPWPAESQSPPKASPEPSSRPRPSAALSWGEVSPAAVDPPPRQVPQPQAEKRPKPPPEPAPPPSPAAAWAGDSSVLASTVEPQAPEPPLFSATMAEPPGRDWASGLLTVIVIALALLLGWMLGRVGWQGTTSQHKAQAESTPPAPVRQNPSPANVPPSVTVASDAAPAQSAPRNPFEPRAPGASKAQTDTEAASNGDLVISQDGRIIFRQNAQVPNASSETESGGAKARNSSAANSVVASPLLLDNASPRLIRRVEPAYPAEARRLRIQGSVVLDANVDKNGEVQELRLISGNTQLATAAAEAVRQWRFAPYRQGGKIVDFKTRLTLNFTLP